MIFYIAQFITYNVRRVVSEQSRNACIEEAKGHTREF